MLWMPGEIFAWRLMVWKFLTNHHHLPPQQPQADPDPLRYLAQLRCWSWGLGSTSNPKPGGSTLVKEDDSYVFTRINPCYDMYKYIYIYRSICLLYEYQLILCFIIRQFCILLILINFKFWWTVWWSDHLWISPRSSGRISSSHVTVPCFNKRKSFFFFETSLKGEVSGGW